MTSLPDNDIKEALSIVYIQAICGMAGCTHSQASKDYGMDITIKDIKRRSSGKYNESGYSPSLTVWRNYQKLAK